MNTAIGLDYRVTVLEHFFGQRAIHSLRDDVRAWCREVRADSVDILEELAALCEQAPALDIMQVDALGIREKQHRVALEQSGVDLAQRIARWVASTEPSRTPKRSVFAPMARQAAALVLASMPA